LGEVTENFLEAQPRGQFTDLDNVLMIAAEIYSRNPKLYCMIIPASPHTLMPLLSEKNEIHVSHGEAVNSFLKEDFRYFLNLLQEKVEEVESPVAFLFLMNIILQYYGNRWTESHGNSFIDIPELDVNAAIERYCSLDEVDVFDADTQGRFFYYLVQNKKFDSDKEILDNITNYRLLLQKEFDRRKFMSFKNRLKEKTTELKYSIDDVDLMDGQEFEKFLSLLFSRMGYKTEVTKASGDQGIDVVAEKNEKRIGIQAKCYSNTVGNSAVQEAVSGKAFYNLDKVIVVTNNFFTESAIQLAQVNGVVLWNRELLKEKIAEVFYK
jgi:HJR/Mrr/RecB family endonuclease